VRNPIVEMAEQATRLLLDQIDAGRGGRNGHAMRVIFPPSLARRASA
jgi:DNA-binding LacI/PurR family transcriptional regulator